VSAPIPGAVRRAFSPSVIQAHGFPARCDDGHTRGKACVPTKYRLSRRNPSIRQILLPPLAAPVYSPRPGPPELAFRRVQFLKWPSRASPTWPGARASVATRGSGAVVSDRGRNAPVPRRPKPCVPGVPTARHKRAPGLALPVSQTRSCRCGSSPAVDRVRASDSGVRYVHRGYPNSDISEFGSLNLRKSAIADLRSEQATNTARGTPGNRRQPLGKASMCFHLSHMDRGDRQFPASRAALKRRRANKTAESPGGIRGNDHG
jgi:hypothetical protein